MWRLIFPYSWVIILLFNSPISQASNVGLIFPENNSERLAIERTFALIWLDMEVASGSSVTYDLYFGTSVNPPLYQSGLTPGWTNGTASTLTIPFNADTTWFMYDETSTLLQYNTTYYWQVVAKISNGDSLNSEVYNFTTVRENTNPSKPQLVYPAIFDKDVPSNNLELQWTASVDQENDPIIYKLYFGTDKNNPPLIEDSLTTNNYVVPFQLDDQAIYFWKVEVVDGYDGSIISTQVQRFTVENYFNDPPTAPVALSPDNKTNVGKEVIFKWIASSDKDNDEIRYNIYVDDDPNPTTLVAQGIGYDQWYTVYIEEAYNRKYWKIEATDGEKTSESQVLSYIPYERPKAPTLLVADSIINVGRRPKLQWSASTPNPDEIIYYDLYLDKNPNPTTLIAPGLRETFFIPVVKDLNSTYYWKIVTRDTSGILFESPVQSFTPWKSNNDSIAIEMIDVEGGEFLLGNPEYTMLVPGFETWGKLFVENITPQRSIFLDDFSMAKYEITYVQYLVFLNAIKDSWYVDVDKNDLLYNPGTLEMDGNGVLKNADPILLCDVKSDNTSFDFQQHSKLNWNGNQLSIKPGFEQYPVNWLSVKGIELFVDWVGKRLPSEAEWEYAARGGRLSRNYMYGGSNNATAAGWFLFGSVNMDNPMTGSNSVNASFNNKGTNVVGLKVANELGLYDISGNVRELCSDYYFENQYLNTEYYNPLGPTSGISRSARGGSFEGLRAEILTRARSLATKGIMGIRTVGNHSTSETVLLHGIVWNEHGQEMKGIALSDGTSIAATTQSGRYQLRVGKGKSIIITPSHPDYTFSPSSLKIEGMDDVVTGLNFTAYLKREVKISGLVEDGNGNGIKNVLIKGFPDNIYTDNNGRFSIYVPEDQEYTLTTDILGYKPSIERVVTVNKNNITNVNFTLEYVGYATLRGRVTNNASGHPVNSIWISGLDTEVYSRGDGSYFAQLTIGWSGTIKPVRTLVSSVFTPAAVQIDSFAGDMEINFKDLATGNTFYNGNVVDIHGNPVEGVKILGFDNKNATTNSNGEFGVEMARGWSGKIVPQLEEYTFSPQSHEAYVAASWDDPPASTPYFVAIPPGIYTISGVVTNEAGRPIQGVLLNGFEQEVRTDINGRYTTWVDSAVSYTILPEFKGHTFNPEKFDTNLITSNITQNFVAVKNSNEGYTITFNISNDNTPTENAVVNFNGSNYASDANGIVSISNVNAGTFNYTITKQGYHEVNASVTVTDKDISKNIVLIPVETTVYTVTFNINDGNTPTENAVVNFNDSNYASDANGIVSISNVNAGTFNYTVTKQGYHEENGSVIVTDEDVSKNIVLIPVETTVYTVTFNIGNGNTPIENAVVNFNASNYTSDTNGIVSISNVVAGTFNYMITKQEYHEANGSVTITDEDVSKNIVLTPIETIVYTVTFNINDGNTPTENAVVNFNDSKYTSDTNGIVSISNVNAGTFNYTITKQGYHEANGSVTITDEDVSKNIVLTPVETTVYSVTFNISDGSTPIENATINFNGSNYTSDVNGIVSITNIEAGTYSYIVSSESYEDTNGTITITDTSVIEEITMLIITGVGDINAREITCYPNPSSGKINIDIKGYSFKEGYITLINSLGQSQIIHLESGINNYIWNDENHSEFANKKGFYVVLIHLDSKLVGVRKLLFK